MLAEAYGVQPERFINKTFASTAPTENANGTAVYTWDVPALRCVSDPTPAVVLSSTDSVKKAMFSKMLTAGGIAHSYTYTLSQIEAFTAPTWTVEPAQSAVTATSATVQATCSLTAGFVCSYCLTTGVTKSLYNNQILVGLDESNTSPASKPYACARAATTTTD